MVEVFLAVGSNLGRRRDNIAAALRLLKQNPAITVQKVSQIIETAPVGGPAQGDYLNAAIKIKTSLVPHVLLDFLHRIEADLGRRRTVPMGPRTIDLDILLYSDKIIKTKRLIVPHPRMLEREFVMVPLREIEPTVDSFIARLYANYDHYNRNKPRKKAGCRRPGKKAEDRVRTHDGRAARRPLSACKRGAA